MEAFQTDFSRMLEVVVEAEREEPDIGARLRGVLLKIVDSLMEA